MKCIKAIKGTKQFEVGEIKRVTDVEADSATRDGYWTYISKSEWKLATRKPKAEEVESVKEKYPANVEGSKEFNKANKKKRSK